MESSGNTFTSTTTRHQWKLCQSSICSIQRSITLVQRVRNYSSTAGHAVVKSSICCRRQELACPRPRSVGRANSVQVCIVERSSCCSSTLSACMLHACPRSVGRANSVQVEGEAAVAAQWKRQFLSRTTDGAYKLMLIFSTRVHRPSYSYLLSYIFLAAFLAFVGGNVLIGCSSGNTSDGDKLIGCLSGNKSSGSFPS